MSTLHLVDPEILPALESFPDIELSAGILPLIREEAKKQLQLGDAEAVGILRDEVHVPGLRASDPPVRCLRYAPREAGPAMAAYLHIHGGGYVMGSPEMVDAFNLSIAAGLGITVLSVDYRLAPEHPVPAPLDDCYAALAWLNASAEELNIDPARIAVGGESAGGGLAAALAQRAHDAGEYPLCFQLLTYPMLDDRTGGAERPGDPLIGEFVWTRERNRFGWDALLGDAPRQAPHVPGRATSLAGLPPAWIGTAGLDLFRDENIAYAQALMAAGVAAELVVYPGCFHGFQRAEAARVSRRFARDHREALGRALAI